MGAGASASSAQLLDDISGNDNEVRLKALLKILDAAEQDVKAVAPLVVEHTAMPVFSAILRTFKAPIKIRETTCEIMFLLASEASTKAVMQQPESRALEILCDICETEYTGKLFSKACRTIGRLNSPAKVNFIKIKKALVQHLSVFQSEWDKITQGAEALGLEVATAKISATANTRSFTELSDAVWGLSVVGAHRRPMGDLHLGLVGVLVAVINTTFGDIRGNALSAVVNLSYDGANRVPLTNNSVGLLQSLVKLLRIGGSTHSNTSSGSNRTFPSCLRSRGGAFTILRNLSVAQENRIVMTAPALGLVPTMARLIQEACGGNLEGVDGGGAGGSSGNLKDRGRTRSFSTGTTATAVVVDAKMLNHACGITATLASVANSRQYIAAAQTGMLDALRALLLMYHEQLNCGAGGARLPGGAGAMRRTPAGTLITMAEETMDLACSALCLLSASSLNFTIMTTEAPVGRSAQAQNGVDTCTAEDAVGSFGATTRGGGSVVTDLVRILSAPQSTPKHNALMSLVNITLLMTPHDEQTAEVIGTQLLAPPEVDLLGALVVVFREGVEENVCAACTLIKNLVRIEEDLKEIITRPPGTGSIEAQSAHYSAGVSVISVLVSAFKRVHVDSAAAESFCNMFWHLAAHPANETRFASKELGLLPPIVACLELSCSMVTKLAACSVIACLSCHPDNEEYLATDEIGLVEVLVAIMKFERNADLRASASSVVSNLSLSPFNKVLFGDATRSGVLKALITVVLEDFGDARLHACGALKSLAVSPVNKPKMIQGDLGLLNTLVKVIRRDRGLARQYCCSALSNLAVAVDNKVIMGRTDLGVIKALSDVIMDDLGESRVVACAALSHLATATQNKLRMFRPEMKTFPALVEVLKVDKGKSGVFACSALNHLSMIPQNKPLMISGEVGFVQVLIDTIWESDDGKLIALCCNCLASLAAAVENRVIMVTGQVGVLEVLVHVLQGAAETLASEYANNSSTSTGNLKKISGNPHNSPGSALDDASSMVSEGSASKAVGNKKKKGSIGYRNRAIAHACACVRSLTVSAENKVYMANPAVGLVSALVTLMKSTLNDAKTNACFAVWNLAVNAENQATLLQDESLGLLRTLVDVVESPRSSEKMRANACGAILNFTTCQLNEKLMVEPQYNLIHALGRVLEQDKGKARDYAVSALCNLSFCSDNKRLMVQEKYELLPALSVMMRESSGDARSLACQCVCRLAAAVSNRSIMTKVEHGLLQALVYVLKTECDPCEARDHTCLTLSYLSDCTHNKPLMTIPKLGLMSVLSDIVESDDGNAKTYAMLTMKNLADAEEKKELLTGSTNTVTNHTEQNPPTNSNVIPPLVEVLRNPASDEKAREVACAALSNLACEDGNKLPMVDPELRLIESLVHVLRNEMLSTSTGLAACSVLWCLADNINNRVPLCNPDYELIPCLVELLRKEQVAPDLKASVCGVCRSLAVDEDNKIYMGDKKLGLIQQLIKRCYEPDEANLREFAVATISNLTVAEENKIAFADSTLGLFPALNYVLKHDTRGGLVAGCAAMHFMACLSSNLPIMGDFDVGVIEALMHVLKTDKGDARANACSALCHVASLPENRAKLGNAELGLMPLLIKVLREDNAKARVFACSTVGFLAVSQENQKYIASFDLGLLVELVRLIRSDNGKTREYCCSITRSLSSSLANKLYMASESLGLLPALVTVLQTDRGKARANACATICNLAISSANKGPMADPELGLVKGLVDAIKADRAEARVNGCAALSYLAVTVENKTKLLEPSLGLLEALKAIVKEDTGKARVNACLTLSNLSVVANTEKAPPQNKAGSPSGLPGAKRPPGAAPPSSLTSTPGQA